MSNDKDVYAVVINHEEQYGLWPVGKALKPGMILVGTQGSRAECEKYIKKISADKRKR